MPEEVDWGELTLPNTPLFRTTLPKHIIDYVWECVEDAKEKDVSWNHNLAGHISKSLEMYDTKGTFWDEVMYPITSHIVDNVHGKWLPDLDHTVRVTPFLRWWVNFSKQTEFNPLHAHSGCLSFALWLKIPTHWRDQHKLPFCHSTGTPAASGFMFTYSDILGNHCEYPIHMSPEMENQMVVFPASLNHQVYPFYGCDEERISVAGNVLWNVKNN
tara:strand:+ start:1376 stop:2020 length:645 start_codon:yes stop_codon:yes gene_type:complete